MNEIVSNGKIFARCCYCEEFVQKNKPIFGSLHICLTEEERGAKDANSRRLQTKNQHDIIR